MPHIYPDLLLTLGKTRSHVHQALNDTDDVGCPRLNGRPKLALLSHNQYPLELRTDSGTM